MAAISRVIRRVVVSQDQPRRASGQLSVIVVLM
jgi:hypothetical protein